jgi:protein phosphatase
VKENVPALISAGATDPGQRLHNEDAFLLEDSLGLYLVADGVGGRAAGEVASRVACDTIRDQVGGGQALPAAITAAHRAIRGVAETSTAARSMAATIVALRTDGTRYRMAWSGDSRGYFWDGQRLLGLTRDHSLVEAMVRRGEITREQARDHPRRNVILAALGGESAAPEIGVNDGRLPAAGTFLLCSDGLTDVLTYDTICRTLREETDLQHCADRLTALAHDAGGSDNITVALVSCGGPGSAGDSGTGLAETAESPDETGAAEGAWFEIYNADSGEHRWPADRPAAPPAPTVRRVRGRSGSTTTGAAPPAPPPSPPPDRRARAALLLAAAVVTALGLAALVISRYPGTP